jgi:hypothetical protein
MNGTKFSCGSERPLALTMPAVTVFSKPKDLELRRVAEAHRRQLTGGLDLEERDVRALVGADQLRLEFALVGELDGDLVGGLDHVRVGEHVAVGADDEARAERAALGTRAGAGGRTGARLARDEAAEKFQHLLVLDAGHLRQRARPASGLRSAYVDDCVALLLHQAREIGQLCLCLGREREHRQPQRGHAS